MSKNQILKALHGKKGEYISLEELASEGEISPEQVPNEIEWLENDDYIIEHSSELGYRLIKVPNRLLPYEIQRDLHTSYIGKEIHYFKEVDSTNEVAKKLAEEGAQEGTIVIAESQTSGKGRLGKKWISPSGGVWMTIVLRPDIPPHQAPQLTLVTGVAMAKTLDKECGLDVGIKWPNDILIGNKKVCGILTEAITNHKLDFVLVGIGLDLNVDLDNFPPELREGATSLKRELHRDIPGVKLVQNFLTDFENLYDEFKAGNFPEILAEWRRHSKTIGRHVEVHKRGRVVTGEAIGVNKDGMLILEMEDGSLRKVMSGECIHLNQKQ
jgi:BirA family transcriptional regulator, biotin operon repressor / biotin---[acetyl-CoA-carboxylase] ligase